MCILLFDMVEQGVLYKLYSRKGEKYAGQKAWARKSTSHNGLWLFTNWVYDIESDDVHFAEILICEEVQTALITNIYGFSEYFWYPSCASCDFTTKYLEENPDFADFCYDEIMSAVSKMFPNITNVVLFNPQLLQELKQRVLQHEMARCICLPLPESICFNIAMLSLPEWSEYDISTTPTSVFIEKGKSLKGDVDAIRELCLIMMDVKYISDIEPQYHTVHDEVMFETMKRLE